MVGFAIRLWLLPLLLCIGERWDSAQGVGARCVGTWRAPCAGLCRQRRSLAFPCARRRSTGALDVAWTNLPARVLLNVVVYGLHKRRDAPLGLAWGLLLCLMVWLFLRRLLRGGRVVDKGRESKEEDGNQQPATQ